MTTRCIQAVKRGDLNELQRLIQVGHPMSKVLPAVAIANHQYDIFEWLKDQGCDTMGIELRHYQNGITGVGKTQTLNKNEARYGFKAC